MNHVHVYDMRGRCIRSVPIGDAASPADAATAVGASGALRKALLDLGFVLREWHDEEQAGLAITGDEQFVVRVKSVGMQRDMLPFGLRRTVEMIEREGVAINRFEAWLMEDLDKTA